MARLDLTSFPVLDFDSGKPRLQCGVGSPPFLGMARPPSALPTFPRKILLRRAEFGGEAWPWTLVNATEVWSGLGKAWFYGEGMVVG